MSASHIVIDGSKFIFDTPAEPESIWGQGAEVLWPRGEPLIIVAPTGAGKTTLAGQLALGRLGIGTGRVLGFPVKPSKARVLYLACDRPRQIARSFRRMVGEPDRERLTDHLAVWQGPPPFDLTTNPEALADFANENGSNTVFIDSLKDMVPELSKDEVGSRVNNAFQHAVVQGIELCILHHPRKANGTNVKPNKIADLYGSVWIPAGAGSVISLWGDPGDPIVELTHLKQPAEPVGPFQVLHDHERGESRVFEQTDLHDLLSMDGPLTAQEAARQLYGAADAKDVQKARRKLDGMVKSGRASRQEAFGKEPVRYSAVGGES